MNLKDNLKRLLKLNDVTAAQLSRSLSIPKSTLSEWLSGRTPKNLDHLKKVSEYFNTTVDELCFGSGIERQENKSNVIKDHQNEIDAGIWRVLLVKPQK